MSSSWAVRQSPECSCGWLEWDSGLGAGAFVSASCFAQLPGLDIIRLQAPCCLIRTREDGRRESKGTRSEKERRVAENAPKVGQREGGRLMWGREIPERERGKPSGNGVLGTWGD